MLRGRLSLSHESPPLRASKCVGFLERARGLLFRPRLAPDEALLIAPCSSVHMFGMTYAIDVVFVDATGRVMQVSPGLRPFRVASCRGAAAAWEFAAGACESFGIAAGVRLSFTPHD